MLKRLILHPFLLAAYAVLALLAHNVAEIKASDGLRTLVILILGTTMLFRVSKAIFRDWHKAGLITTILIAFFFTYGHIYGSLKSTTLLGLSVGRHRVLIPLFFALLVIGLWWGIRKVREPTGMTQFLNVVALIAIIFPVYQIASFEIRTLANARALANAPTEVQRAQFLNFETSPDVYYIVLDAYARDDVLRDRFGYDNSDFLDALTEMGFYVAQCSQSNYAKTKFSLASTLNFNYLDALGGNELKRANGEPDWVKIGQLIRRGKFRKFLESIDYKVVAFQTGYFWTEWDDADLYLADNDFDIFGNLHTFGQINNFEVMFFKTSFGLALSDSTTIFGATLQPIVDESPQQQRYQQVNFTLDTLEKAATIPGPKFVFAHILSPHGPYVFGPDGEFLLTENTQVGYINQITSINKRVLSIMREILTNSEIPPIIVIQGDHGAPHTQPYPDRMSILNIYYLPQGGHQQLFNTITPVNSFRLIANYYFGANYDLLDDISYHSTSDDFFDLNIVSNPCETEK